MKRHRSILVLILLAGAPCVKLAAQDANFGVAVPMTITGGALDTGRVYADDPSAAQFTAGFRVLATPELKLGSHWYVYSAVQVHSTPFFYQDAYDADRKIEIQAIQGFLGYARSWGKTSLNFKVGKLSSAFGAFPLRYDDTENPLLDQPLLYNYLAVQPGQLPCKISDYNLWPSWGFFCGPSWGSGYGVAPATLYGLPGVEAEISRGRLDTRVQITNSSPSNPKGFFSSGQHPQWTVGGGYTIRQGFRVGMSAFRGPWLDNALKPSLPQGSAITDFPASGLGVDVQWAQGHWNASGEWGRFVFGYPTFKTAPTSNFGYIEMKRNISPRWYSAMRANFGANNRPEDSTGHSMATFLPNRQAYEVAVGFRPDRFQLIKVGYEWMHVAASPNTHDNVLGVQFITSFNSLSKSFK